MSATQRDPEVQAWFDQLDHPLRDVMLEVRAAALDDAGLLTQRAVQARERAADPALPAPQREVHLLAAAEQLLHARRVLQAVSSGDAPALTQRLDGLRALLLATWLDLADLAR